MAGNWDELADVAVAKLGDQGAHVRGEVRRYLTDAAGKGYPVAHVVRLLHAHAALDDAKAAHTDTTHHADCVTMTMMERRVLIGFSAGAHQAGNWTPTGLLRDCIDEGNPVIGSLIARMMTRQPFEQVDVAVFDRLTETLTHDELVALVCTTAAMLGALGFRLADLLALDPAYVAPVDQAEPVDQGDQGDGVCECASPVAEASEKPGTN